VIGVATPKLVNRRVKNAGIEILFRIILLCIVFAVLTHCIVSAKCQPSIQPDSIIQLRQAHAIVLLVCQCRILIWDIWQQYWTSR
jgi:hypothetical protein